MSAPHILVLAAGQGKRMYSSLPKVLHPVLYRPMLHHLLDVAKAIPHRSLNVIVGHGEEQVREACSTYPEIQYFVQSERKGTAHAVRMASPFLKGQTGNVVILSGDVVLLRKETLEKLVEEHASREPACTLLTATLPNPTGYGRIVRDGDKVKGIREEADCSPLERTVREVNAGIYVFDIGALHWALERISDKNRQNEFYLTDAVELLANDKKIVMGVELDDASEMTGINDRQALAQGEVILQKRINGALMKSGVTMRRPDTIAVDARCKISADVVIESGCVLIDSEIAKGAVIESGCRISNSKIGENTVIKQGSYLEESVVGNECSVGPYAHLRPGTKLEAEVKIGNFVEVKKSTLKKGAKASHLSYIGDAEIGQNVNLGCGFITCNYDGVNKHKTVIEDDVFVGSDSQMIAPVTVGKGSYIASGTTVSKDVPADALAISRVKQLNKLDYAKKFRKK